MAKKPRDITAPDLRLSIRLRQQLNRDFARLEERLLSVMKEHESERDVQSLSIPLRGLKRSVRRMAWGAGPARGR